MTTAGYVRPSPAGFRLEADRDEDGTAATRTLLDGAADLAARVPWLAPVLVTLALGCYQIGRPSCGGTNCRAGRSPHARSPA